MTRAYHRSPVAPATGSRRTSTGYGDLRRVVRTLVLGACLMSGARAAAQPSPTVLHVASERHASLAFDYAYFPQFVRLGFGTSAKPWHTWFGSPEMGTLLHLPGYQPGRAVRVEPAMVIGSRFAGRTWASAFDALRSFDTDHNGLVERGELDTLYVWVDWSSDGTIAADPSWVFPVRQRHAGFDLRRVAVDKEGFARRGRMAPFAVIGRNANRMHLVEMTLDGAFANEMTAYLSYAGAADGEASHPFSGEWTWVMTDTSAWGQAAKSWQGEGGRLILAARGTTLRGVVQYRGVYGDRINLPLEGTVEGDHATWTSVSPLGLTRSEVRLAREASGVTLQGRAASNRNATIQRWTWSARRAKPVE